jgi:intraflagellar transport protein 88
VISLSETIFHIGHINELVGNIKQGLKWYQIILTKLPNDAGILARVGNIFFR